ncbi:hypothetical protein COC55_06565 [Bacillus cereus]|nr:hypothetical protein COC55_06565 [Bacillus cereus]
MNKHGFGTEEKAVFESTLTREETKLLNPIRSVYQVLGTLARRPQLLLQPRMALCEDDFVQDFHKMVFGAIKDIICKDNSIKRLTHVDIDNHLSTDDELYALWEECNGIYYMQSAIEYSTNDTFKIHYRELKKHTLMRQFVCADIDIQGVYDYMQKDLRLLMRSTKRVESLTLEELENALIPLGTGNSDMQRLLSDQQHAIDSQIDMLVKRKKELESLQDKLK